MGAVVIGKVDLSTRQQAKSKGDGLTERQRKIDEQRKRDAANKARIIAERAAEQAERLNRETEERLRASLMNTGPLRVGLIDFGGNRRAVAGAAIEHGFLDTARSILHVKGGNRQVLRAKLRKLG